MKKKIKIIWSITTNIYKHLQDEIYFLNIYKIKCNL